MEPPILGFGTSRDLLSIALATRAGRRIDNIRPDPLPRALMDVRIGQHRQSHPNVILRSAASTYNCVGMALANRRTAVDVTLVPRILREDNYRQIPFQAASLGDLVLYFDSSHEPSHVGLVASPPPRDEREVRQFQVLSQWGLDGEYLHALHDVPPLLGTPREIWTDRVPAR